jgi:Uma2 family endonuclease
MNEAVRHMPATTQAADGLPRRRWTFDEIVHLTELGVFGGIDRPRERFELIGGEIVPLSPKGNRHEWLKKELLRHWLKQAAADVDIISETTLRFSDVGFVEPDIFIWPRSIPLADIACNTALLLVEIADASFSFDTNTKTKLYASLGLREYWVINARTLVTSVYTEPQAEGFGSLRDAAPAELITPGLAPALALRVADLGLQPL